MSRMVLEAEQFAEAGVAQQRYAHLEASDRHDPCRGSADQPLDCSRPRDKPIRRSTSPRTGKRNKVCRRTPCTALLQDHEGYLWMAHTEGSSALMAKRFRVFGAGATPGFDSDKILCSVRESFRSLVDRDREPAVSSGWKTALPPNTRDRDGLPSRLISSIRGDSEGKHLDQHFARSSSL